jgi:hypothetical protein
MVLSVRCGKPDCDDTASGIPLTLDERVQSAVAWNEFKNTSNDQLDATQYKIDALRDKIYLAPAKDKVKIRRIINKNEYYLDKLRKSLYDYDVWFEKHINAYSDKDAEKIAKFEKRFHAELDRINTEIKDCNC